MIMMMVVIAVIMLIIIFRNKLCRMTATIIFDHDLMLLIFCNVKLVCLLYEGETLMFFYSCLTARAKFIIPYALWVIAM